MPCFTHQIKWLGKSGAVLALLTTVHSAQAFEFVSVDTPAILYDAPSLKAKKLYVASRYLPLEQIVVLDNWVKARDSSGSLFWIEKRALSSKRYVTVTAAVSAVRSSPDANAGIVFQGAQHLALEWLADAPNGWAKVRHLDGAEGYIKISEVWGE